MPEKKRTAEELRAAVLERARLAKEKAAIDEKMNALGVDTESPEFIAYASPYILAIGTTRVASARAYNEGKAATGLGRITRSFAEKCGVPADQLHVFGKESDA